MRMLVDEIKVDVEAMGRKIRELMILNHHSVGDGRLILWGCALCSTSFTTDIRNRSLLWRMVLARWMNW